MIPSQRHLFDLPRERVYLNAAYMGPMPKTAIAAGEDSYRRKGQPWTYDIQDDFFDRPDAVRAQAAQLYGAADTDIALVPAASYGLATAARNLAPQKRSETWSWTSNSRPMSMSGAIWPNTMAAASAR